MKTGDFVEVKKGTKIPELGQFDFSGWTGVVGDIYNPQNPGEERIMAVKLDIETIKRLPVEFIESCIKDWCSFSELNIEEKDLTIRENPGKDNEKERAALIQEIGGKYAYAGFDEEEELISAILDDTDISVNEANLSKFRQYLISNLKEPVYLTGVEDFPWEERFFFGVGSEREHAELRKSRPSSRDTFKLLKILDADTYESDLFAKVRRESDGKIFEIMLSWLEATDEDSENYALLQTFSIWIVNY